MCRAEWLTGYKISEVIGVNCFVMKHPADVHDAKQYLKRTKICESTATCLPHGLCMLVALGRTLPHLPISPGSVQGGVLLRDTIPHCHVLGPVDLAGKQGLAHFGKEWRAIRDSFLLQNIGVCVLP